MLRAETPSDRAINTGATWQVRRDTGRTSSSGRQQLNREIGQTYYAAGAPEQLTGAGQRDGWTTDSGGTDWQAPATTVIQGDRTRTLVADALPPMRYDAVDSGKVVRVTGISAARFPNGRVTIPARSEATILIDAGRVLAAYPALVTSQGKGTTVTLTYTEAMYDPVAMTPGPRRNAVRFADRARVDNGRALGLTDTILPDGRAGQEFAPFW